MSVDFKLDPTSERMTEIFNAVKAVDGSVCFVLAMFYDDKCGSRVAYISDRETFQIDPQSGQATAPAGLESASFFWGGWPGKP